MAVLTVRIGQGSHRDLSYVFGSGLGLGLGDDGRSIRLQVESEVFLLRREVVESRGADTRGT